jgi:hypothetical protein
MIATGGWKITRENIDKLIPDLHELMSGLPIGTPIVWFSMDNSSFLATSEDGGMEFLSTIISDLTKLKFQLRKKLQPAVIIDGIELACGTGCGREKVEQTLRAGWALDPVHPNGHIYAKMALNLIEKVANPASKQESRKRKRSDDSTSGSGS